MNLYASLLRTGIPALVGWLFALSTRYGLELDSTALTGVLTPVCIFVYYAVFRLAEKYLSPRFGWLLGFARPPEYPSRRRSLPSH